MSCGGHHIGTILTIGIDLYNIFSAMAESVASSSLQFASLLWLPSVIISRCWMGIAFSLSFLLCRHIDSFSLLLLTHYFFELERRCCGFVLSSSWRSENCFLAHYGRTATEAVRNAHCHSGGVDARPSVRLQSVLWSGDAILKAWMGARVCQRC